MRFTRRRVPVIATHVMRAALQSPDSRPSRRAAPAGHGKLWPPPPAGPPQRPHPNEDRPGWPQTSAEALPAGVIRESPLHTSASARPDKAGGPAARRGRISVCLILRCRGRTRAAPRKAPLAPSDRTPAMKGSGARPFGWRVHVRLLGVTVKDRRDRPPEIAHHRVGIAGKTAQQRSTLYPSVGRRPPSRERNPVPHSVAAYATGGSPTAFASGFGAQTAAARAAWRAPVREIVPNRAAPPACVAQPAQSGEVRVESAGPVQVNRNPGCEPAPVAGDGDKTVGRGWGIDQPQRRLRLGPERPVIPAPKRCRKADCFCNVDAGIGSSSGINGCR